MALVETWVPVPSVESISARQAIGTWLSARLAAFIGCVGVLAAAAYVHGVNLANWPSLENEDEGTYMARVWAVQTGHGAHHGLANYTYRYDHAPFGWMQLVPWTWITGAFTPGTNPSIAGRQIMVAYGLVSILLVYVIARRLAASRPAALGAMALFAFSPLAVGFTREVFLDSIGMPWALGAFALALSPRRKLWAFAASGACLAAACLSKETYLLLAPALVYTVFQRADPRARRMCLVMFSSVALGLMVLWPLYAVLKGELIPGHGHVSLIGSIEWQLGQRRGSGSVLSAGSDAHLKMFGWFDTDPWLVGASALSLIPALYFRRLRPLAIGLVVAIAYAVHGGYLPAMYIEGFLPFMALIVACSADLLLRPALSVAKGLHVRSGQRHHLRVAGGGLVLGSLVVVGTLMAPAWVNADQHAMTGKANAALFQAEDFVQHHVPKSAMVLVDANVWSDLVGNGFAPHRVVSFWELGADPEVNRRYPAGWRQMDYVVATNTVRVNVVSNANRLQPLVKAIVHSSAVATFGSGSSFVTVYAVHPNGPIHRTWWLPGYGSLHPPMTGPQKGEQL